MGKLKPFSGMDICRLLNTHGFQEVRRKGSHIIMQKRDLGSTVTVPVPNHQDLKTGTLMSIIRQSGLSRSEFES